MLYLNEEFNSETSVRNRFFQTIQAWPLSDNFNYEGWLNNFHEGEEKSLASLMIDFFTYYPANMVDKMLAVSVGNAGYVLKKKFPTWTQLDFKEKCIFSFIPGENPNPTDSGNFFTRKLRNNLNIPESQIVDFANVPNYANEERPVILVDDFVGSGSQVYNAWIKRPIPKFSNALSKIAHDNNITVIYAPLLVNKMGYNLITAHCPGLFLSPCHILTEEYNLFSPKCYAWKGDASLFQKGTQLIIEKSKQLGIPFTGGQSTIDAKGFGEQGLALCFEHGAPDAIPSFFYWCSENWTPLIIKHYER